jgi:hypothetical protein
VVPARSKREPNQTRQRSTSSRIDGKMIGSIESRPQPYFSMMGSRKQSTQPYPAAFFMPVPLCCR